MALPKLNENPSYSIEVPSTGQKTTFRPFLVKEQKNLLIAYETQERKDMVRAILRTIDACVEEPLEGKLTTFDVDYLFTKIRAKSVGESADIQVSCSECGEANKVSVELDDIKMSGETTNNLIEITDSVSIQMRYPSYEEFLNNDSLLSTETTTEGLWELLVVCMEAVLTDEERISMNDQSKEDVLEFIDSMTSDQFAKVSEFINSVPSVTQDVKFECTSCGHSNERTLKGMDDFF